MARSKWDGVKDKLLLVEAWARDGDTDKIIAKKLGISESTLNEYKKQHPEFSESLKKGKEVVDVEVENALLKRAKGYEYTEEKIEVETKADGTPISRKVVQTIKQVVPDVGAAAFWLKNRRSNKWRDKQPENLSIVENEDDPITKSLKEEFGK